MRKSLTPKTFLFLAVLSLMPAASFAQVAITVAVAPPALPVNAQPPCPVDEYMWTPGYWAGGRRATTGFRACGSRRRALGFSGRRVIGDSRAACMAGTLVTGDRT